MLRFLLLSVALLLLSCASATPQADELLLRTEKFPREHLIKNVPYFRQTAGYCGPATLAMAMGALGYQTTPEELGAQAYTPGMKGTFQEDMISTSRRQGFLAIPIRGMEALFTELRANHPVIVFENLAFSWLPQWHYALVYGYDLNSKKIIMHSGPDKEKHWDLRRFERSWQLADYWGLVLLNPGDFAASVGELEHSKAAAALEAIGKIAEAETSYKAILKRWPESLAAAVGLANIAYARGDNKEALQVLSELIEYQPSSAVAWYNLAVAQKSLNKNKEARRSALKAISLAEDPEEKATLRKEFESWLE